MLHRGRAAQFVRFDKPSAGTTKGRQVGIRLAHQRHSRLPTCASIFTVIKGAAMSTNHARDAKEAQLASHATDTSSASAGSESPEEDEAAERAAEDAVIHPSGD